MIRTVAVCCLLAAAVLPRQSQAASHPTAPVASFPPATAETPLPHIPDERIVFKGQGYPIIPDDVKALIKYRDDILEAKAQGALAKAMPEIEAWAKKGKPYIRVARKPSDLPQAKIPAFPGAQGGGMYSFGGRGGRVFVVSNLKDSGPGSFREACEAGGPRIVVFNVAGIIHLTRPLDILAPYISIEGQSAPGDGVCIAGATTNLRTHDIVVRYMRFRRGATDISDRDDALSGDSIGNVILDHVSASWGLDETLSNYRQMYNNPETGKREKLPTMNITIQWCLITEALDTYHHGFGATWGGWNTAFHHNLFACNTGRNASIGMNHDFNWVNNVVFNWRHRTLDGGGGGSEVNVINNYYKPGPATNKGELQYRVGKPEGGQWYAAGNIVEGNEKVTADNWAGGIQGDRVQEAHVEKPFPMPVINVDSAQDAYEKVLADAGAVLPVRDAVDARAVRQVRSGKPEHGDGIITDPAQVGGYPAYMGEPVKCTQNDGIPDWWKKKYHLDVNDAGLASKDLDGDGYTTIEEYLNGTDPTEKVDYTDRALATTNPLDKGAKGKLVE